LQATDEQKKKQAEAKPPPETPVAHPPTNSYYSPTPAVSPARSPRAFKGKLQMAKQVEEPAAMAVVQQPVEAPRPAAATITAPPVAAPLPLSVVAPPVEDDIEDIDLADDDGDGWDDDDLGSADSADVVETPKEETAAAVPEAPVPESDPALGSVTSIVKEEAVVLVETPPKAQVVAEKEEPRVEEDTVEVAEKEEPPVEEDTVEEAAAEIKTEASQSTSTTSVDAAVEKETEIKQPQTADDVRIEAPVVVEPEEEAGPTKKLLMLCSIESLNRQATKRQENAFTILKGRGLAYEVIDATDPVNTTWREELFQLADGVREYPLFFLMDLSDGETTFWGNFDRFTFANDEGTLSEEVSGANTTPWDPSMFVQPVVRSPPPTPTRNGGTPKSLGSEKEQLMKSFSEQMKRMEENHQAEFAELEKKQAQGLLAAATSVTHDECIAQRKKLEEDLNFQIQKKNEKLSDLLRTNEGLKLKIDLRTREVTGMQQLLEKGDTEVSKAVGLHKRDLKVLQEQLLDREEKASHATQEMDKAEVAKQSMMEELEKTQKEHAELRNRAKEIAGELRTRRAECTSLRSQVDELTENKQSLEHSLENLTLKLSNHNINKSEKDGEMGRLRNELDVANNQVKELQTQMQSKEAAAEKALNDFKKKAQNSLAMVNSRTASAAEAKEEAELEARAARSTADTAMERAVKAEIASKEVVAEAKAYVADMEKQTAKAKADLAVATSEAEALRVKMADSQKEVESMVGAKNNLVTDLAHAQGRLEEELGRSQVVRDEVERHKQQLQATRDEVGKLRQQLRRAEVAKSEAEESNKSSKKSDIDPSVPDRNSDDATISMLQRQLTDANEVIEDLKKALENAADTHETAHPAEDHAGERNGSRGSAPLYYAMEKQAELKTAQNEINRLANLLADVQTDKMEAVETKEEMRQRMEDAEAKLQRYKKLGNSSVEDQNGLDPMPKNSGSTNIEYLKNIMMTYLKAKTVAEKKALVPVIAAVLCLTPEEQQSAFKSLEDSASLGAVGTSLFESFSGRFT
jgi:hypothetical protein